MKFKVRVSVIPTNVIDVCCSPHYKKGMLSVVR